MVEADDGSRGGRRPASVPRADPAEIDRFVGNRLRSLRHGFGLEPGEFARRIGVTRHLLLRYETGQRPLPAAVLMQASAVCECLPDSFFPVGGGGGGDPRAVEDVAETRRLTGLFEACPAPLRRRILAFARAVAQA